MQDILASVQKPNELVLKHLMFANCIHGLTHELVLKHLMYANCVPSLAHAAELKTIPSNELNDCDVVLNNGFRRIFAYNRWESTKYLRLTIIISQ